MIMRTLGTAQGPDLVGRHEARDVLRVMLGASVGASVIQLLGCGSGSSVSDPNSTGGDQCTAKIPEETAGPLPRRRLERPRRTDGDRRGAP
jgi:hypothetical protein